MGLRETIKDIIEGMKEKRDIEDVEAEVAQLKAAEDGGWKKTLEARVEGEGRTKKPESGIRETAKVTENGKADRKKGNMTKEKRDEGRSIGE